MRRQHSGETTVLCLLAMVLRACHQLYAVWVNEIDHSTWEGSKQHIVDNIDGSDGCMG